MKFIRKYLIGAAFIAASIPDAAEVNPMVILETNRGSIVIELFAREAPITVSNFLELVDSNYYDGVIFHRVIQGFVIQAGGFDREFNFKEGPRTIPNEAHNGVHNAVGTLAMAQKPADPNSASAQFFINLVSNNHLNQSPTFAGYAVFGKVVEGMEVVRDVADSETQLINGMEHAPVEPTVILSARRTDPS